MSLGCALRTILDFIMYVAKLGNKSSDCPENQLHPKSTCRSTTSLYISQDRQWAKLLYPFQLQSCLGTGLLLLRTHNHLWGIIHHTYTAFLIPFLTGLWVSTLTVLDRTNHATTSQGRSRNFMLHTGYSCLDRYYIERQSLWQPAHKMTQVHNDCMEVSVSCFASTDYLELLRSTNGSRRTRVPS